LRYSGVTVMPLISVFEEICQCVPVEMVTPEWLLSASGEPRMFYIKKLKRAFDIIVSLAGLLFLWPFLLFGMILVKITSPQGPVFYRQTRSGRFGHAFTLLKLRTMRPDAETGDTAVWASTKDPRAVPGGNFLRRYRVDEIPQMWNVLRGEMSFVGPRPERPEFVEMLAEQIPFYRERLLIQPGITGWAQVNHPYAASVADARHKLEYDLYYAKNMSLFLDMFILLDTVRIILRGGVKKSSAANLLQQRVARREQAASEAKLGLPATAGVHHWMV
jgi:lipopolysaccharide/colanic/teichoic acid biosynthesis glycosyltransferase